MSDDSSDALRQAIELAVARCPEGDDLVETLMLLFEGPYEHVQFYLKPTYTWQDEMDRSQAQMWAEMAFQCGNAVANYRLSGVLVVYHQLLTYLHGTIGCDPECEQRYHTPLAAAAGPPS